MRRMDCERADDRVTPPALSALPTLRQAKERAERLLCHLVRDADALTSFGMARGAGPAGGADYPSPGVLAEGHEAVRRATEAAERLAQGLGREACRRAESEEPVAPDPR